MAKGIAISLATKCQLLFGLAVLVIIGGVLAVPWQRMEQLAGQQNVKAARMLADAAFRDVHQNIPAGRLQAPGTEPRTPGPLLSADGDHWSDISLVDLADYPKPRIVALQSSADPLNEQDKITREALEYFRARAQETEYGRVENVGKEKERVYRYAAAVRLDKSCLDCHSQWTVWVSGKESGEASSATTHPAATMAAPATWPVVAIVRVDLPYQTDDAQLLLNRIVIAVSGILGGTLAIVVFYLITNRLILQPVRVLKNTAEKVSMGDLNIRSAISTGDEFEQLSETFNRMLATLKASQDQLEATNQSLDSRVGELAQSNVDLYEANRLKSEFLTNVSHELRTPLNAIIGFTDLLADNAATRGEPKLTRYAENIQVSAKQLLDLINDLLDLAKIEAGKMVLRPEKINVTDVCEAMVNFMKPLAQKKNIELSLDAPEPMPLLTTDPGRFQQILYNFISNAIKFTPNDGKVVLGAKGEGESSREGATHIRVSVTDTGPGIAPEDQVRIFEKFRQLDGSVTRQHSGSGLGLAISRELADMLGARIDVASEVGRGSTFSLILPVTPPTAQ